MQDSAKTSPPVPTQRQFLMLAIGGSVGAVLWLLSLFLAYRWRGTIFGGLEAWQGADWWQLWVCLLAMLGGLAIMFFSLLPLRAVERSNVALRRLLYGYNAVLTGLLLLAILMVGNVLVYNYVTPSFDWTQSGIYTLSDRSKNILRALDKPTKIYAVLISGSEITTREVRTLLDNCRAVNDKLQVEYVAPDLDPAKMRKLMADYQFTGRQGLIIVYGEEGKAEYQVIKDTDLFAADPTRPDRFTFKGEDALMTALSHLEEGKSRSVVYFTQGNGEMDLTDASGTGEGQGLGALRERLQKGNYDVKGLQFSPVSGGKAKSPFVVMSDRVPDDAEIVVVAGPRLPLPEFAVKALRDYMMLPAEKEVKKKGKLVVMLDMVLNPAKAPVKVGIEALLAEFDVKVGDDRILSYNARNPLRIPIQGNFGSRNPIARTFSTERVIVTNARTVEPAKPANPNMPASGRYLAEPILLAPNNYTWVDTNLRADPGQLVTDLLNNRDELQKVADQDPSSVVVAVGEAQPTPGADPHAFMRPPEQKPRLIVFGSASFASNPYMAESSGQPNYDLFSSSLAWLRERPSSIGLKAKERNIFVLNVGDEVISRMRWLPVMFMLITIIGLGTGVWLIRRR